MEALGLFYVQGCLGKEAEEPQLSDESFKLQPVVLRTITINISHGGFKLFGQSQEALTDGFSLEDKKYSSFRVIFSLGPFFLSRFVASLTFLIGKLLCNRSHTATVWLLYKHAFI